MVRSLLVGKVVHTGVAGVYSRWQFPNVFDSLPPSGGREAAEH